MLEQQTHSNKDFGTQWLVSDWHHKSLQRHRNRITTYTRSWTLTLTQMRMCPCTLHTLRKTRCKHLFRATGSLSAVKPQSICVDPASISSVLAAHRDSTSIDLAFFWLCNSAEHALNPGVVCRRTYFLSCFYFSCSKIRVACFGKAAVVLTLQWGCLKCVKRT